MKIVSARVKDPRVRGEYFDPYLIVTTDEEINESGQPRIHPEGDLRVVPCGPFFGVDAGDPSTLPAEGSIWMDVYAALEDKEIDQAISDINTSDLLREKIMHVVAGPPDIQFDLTMEVKRVRRLLRQNNLDYEVILDEQAALLGLLKWRLEDKPGMCYGGAVPAADRCKLRPVTTVMEKNTHLPLCSGHLLKFQNKLRDRRINQSTQPR